MDKEKLKLLRNKIDIGLQDAVKLLDKYSDVHDAIHHWNKLKEVEIQKELNRKYDDISEIWMFDEAHCENMLLADKEYLKPFTRRYATIQWSLYVSEMKHHLMLVNKDDDWKIRDIKIAKYNWAKDWEVDNFEAFYKNVAPMLDWEMDDKVIFFWCRAAGLETTWRLLCKYWISFLYNDEMNIVINPNSQQVLILGVHGYVALAKIKLTKTTE